MTTPTFQQAMRRLQGTKKQIAAIKEARIQAMVEGMEYYGSVLIAEHFQQGNHVRMGWPALSPEYARRKVRRFGDSPMLVATGGLRDSIVGKENFNIKVDRRKNNPVTLVFHRVKTVGTYDLGGIHENGAGVPARPWSQPTPEDIRRIQMKTESSFRTKLNMIYRQRR